MVKSVGKGRIDQDEMQVFMIKGKGRNVVVIFVIFEYKRSDKGFMFRNYFERLCIYIGI